MRVTRARRWVPSVVALRCVLGGCCGLLILVTGSGIPMVAAGAAAGAVTRSAEPLGTLVIPNLGLGYAVSSQGPIDPAPFAANSPDPAAAEAALTTLAASSASYEREWQAEGGRNEVQDLLVRFPDAVGAKVFLRDAQHSLDSGEIVSSDPLPSIPGARRVVYIVATDHDGVGEAVSMLACRYVDLLSLFSAASGNAHPISPANAERVARAQYKCSAPRPWWRRRAAPPRPGAPARRRASRPAPSASRCSWWPCWPPRWPRPPSCADALVRPVRRRRRGGDGGDDDGDDHGGDDAARGTVRRRRG